MHYFENGSLYVTAPRIYRERGNRIGARRWQRARIRLDCKRFQLAAVNRCAACAKRRERFRVR